MIFNFRQQILQEKHAKNRTLTEVLGWFFIDLSGVTRIGSMSGQFWRCPCGRFFHWTLVAWCLTKRLRNPVLAAETCVGCGIRC